MFTERIRTIGFGLLGCGRGDEGMPLSILPSHRNILRDKTYDKERGRLREEVRKGLEVFPGSEGYYELCVRSVEAVCWDPLSDDVPDYAREVDLSSMFDISVNPK
jgi:hypothetical protein